MLTKKINLWTDTTSYTPYAVYCEAFTEVHPAMNNQLRREFTIFVNERYQLKKINSLTQASLIL